MKSQTVLVLALVGLCSSSAIATMGPPVAGLEAGQFGVGLGYSTSDIGIEGTTKNTKNVSITEFRLVDLPHVDEGDLMGETFTVPVPGNGEKVKFKDNIESDMIFANLGYGVSDKLELFLLLGMADLNLADESDMDSSNEFAYGFGAKTTFYEKGYLRLGALFQMNWFSFDGDLPDEKEHFGYVSVMRDMRIDGTLDITSTWEMNYYQLKFAVGPTYELMEGVSIYGGPFYYFLSGDYEVKRTGGLTQGNSVSNYEVNTFEKESGDIDEQSNFGAYFGTQIDIIKNLPLCIEYQFTGDADVLGANLVYRF